MRAKEKQGKRCGRTMQMLKCEAKTCALKKICNLGKGHRFEPRIFLQAAFGSVACTDYAEEKK